MLHNPSILIDLSNAESWSENLICINCQRMTFEISYLQFWLDVANGKDKYVLSNPSRLQLKDKHDIQPICQCNFCRLVYVDYEGGLGKNKGGEHGCYYNEWVDLGWPSNCQVSPLEKGLCCQASLGWGEGGVVVWQEAMRGLRCWFCFDDPDLIHLRPKMVWQIAQK